MMVARTRHEPATLTVTFWRDGEEPEQHLVAIGGGRRALIVAVTLLLHREALRAGDRLTIEASDDQH
jgi:hypothetical protein